MKKTKSTQVMERQQIPLISYKAEIIWDPQPPYSDEINEIPKKKMIYSYTKKTIVPEKVSLPAFVNLERDNYT
jgi:hypothetical protein